MIDHGGHTSEVYYDADGCEIERAHGELVVSFRLHYGTYPGDDNQPVVNKNKKVSRKDFDAFEAARVMDPNERGD